MPGARIVYIGEANLGTTGKRGLRKRLNEFRKYGAGSHTTGHSGGRRIGQLVDHAEFLVGCRVTDDIDAVRIETEMIVEFRAQTRATRLTVRLVDGDASRLRGAPVRQHAGLTCPDSPALTPIVVYHGSGPDWGKDHYAVPPLAAHQSSPLTFRPADGSSGGTPDPTEVERLAVMFSDASDRRWERVDSQLRKLDP